MNHAEILWRLDDLTAAARARQATCDGIFSATLGGAEIMFMTPDEVQERHQLMLQLPTFADMRAEAKERIRLRLATKRRGANAPAGAQ